MQSLTWRNTTISGPSPSAPTLLAPRLSVAHRSVCPVDLPRFAGRPGAEPGAAQAQVEVRAEPIAFFQRNSSTFIDELNSAGCPTLRCSKPLGAGPHQPQRKPHRSKSPLPRRLRHPCRPQRSNHPHPETAPRWRPGSLRTKVLPKLIARPLHRKNPVGLAIYPLSTILDHSGVHGDST
jgi:hypothetical protein